MTYGSGVGSTPIGTEKCRIEQRVGDVRSRWLRVVARSRWGRIPRTRAGRAESQPKRVRGGRQTDDSV